jgi:hypothetical protein
MSDALCFGCAKPLLLTREVGRGDACPHCRADVRCCRNCKFYDPGSYNECREPVAERVQQKDRANFCDFFEPGAAGPGSGKTSKDALMKAAEALFKKK